jgi:hypothetical protein
MQFSPERASENHRRTGIIFIEGSSTGDINDTKGDWIADPLLFA